MGLLPEKAQTVAPQSEYFFNTIPEIASAELSRGLKNKIKRRNKTMNKTKFNRFILCLVCVMVIAAMAFCTFGCEKNQGVIEKPQVSDTSNADASASDSSIEETSKEEIAEVGVGNTVFDFEVVDGEGNVTKFKVKTDKKTVGEALVDAKLIEGDNGAYGLYVKKVNGIEADYDKDKTYWAFYINGEMAMTGVDKTDIKDGAVYKFKVEK